MLEVSVEPDLATLNQALQTIDPLSDAEAQTILGNIVLTGTVSGAEQAQRMIEIAELFNPPSSTGAKFTVKNHLNVSGEQQVLLRCIVAEVNRTASRQLGINGFLAGDNFSEGFLINQVGGVNPINIGAGADALVTQNIPFLTGEDGIPNGTAPTLTLGFPRVQMEVFIKALRNNGLLRVLAEPNLVATSGETATFLAGGEFPYPVPQGLGSVGVEFKEYGVQLNFTPVVRVGETILLRVQPRVSELDFSAGVILEGYSVPGVTARTAQTTVEIGSGQTIAIAGLLSERTRGVSNSVPGLGDLPVLGGAVQQRGIHALDDRAGDLRDPADRLPAGAAPGRAATGLQDQRPQRLGNCSRWADWNLKGARLPRGSPCGTEPGLGPPHRSADHLDRPYHARPVGVRHRAGSVTVGREP